jgi:hypothetical protein
MDLQSQSTTSKLIIYPDIALPPPSNGNPAVPDPEKHKAALISPQGTGVTVGRQLVSGLSLSTLLQPSKKPPNKVLPPPIPYSWIWRCCMCGASYRLACTRRCLECSHEFCTSTDSGSMQPMRGDRTAKRRRRRGGPCKAEFDYAGWGIWGAWRRSYGVHNAKHEEDVEPRKRRKMTDMASSFEIDALAMYRPRQADSLRSSKWERVPDQKASEITRKKEALFLGGKHDCRVHCDFPSECHHSIYAAKLAEAERLALLARKMVEAAPEAKAGEKNMDPWLTGTTSCGVSAWAENPSPAADENMTGITKRVEVTVDVSPVYEPPSTVGSGTPADLAHTATEPGFTLEGDTLYDSDHTDIVMADVSSLTTTELEEALDDGEGDSENTSSPRTAVRHQGSPHKIAQLTGCSSLFALDHVSKGRSLTHRSQTQGAINSKITDSDNQRLDSLSQPLSTTTQDTWEGWWSSGGLSELEADSLHSSPTNSSSDPGMDLSISRSLLVGTNNTQSIFEYESDGDEEDVDNADR